MNTKDKLRDYFQGQGALDRVLEDDESLLVGGILDSFAIVKLLSYIELEFAVEISDADFDPENFESIDAIASLIARVRV